MLRSILLFLMLSSQYFNAQPKLYYWCNITQSSVPHVRDTIESPLGVIVNEDYTSLSNLDYYSVTHPHSTWSCTGGFLNSTCTGGNNHTDYAMYNAYGSTVLDRWVDSTTLYVRQVDANSTGVVFGTLENMPIGSPVQYRFFLNCLSGLTGIMAIYDIAGNTKVEKDSIKTIAVNDKIAGVVTRFYGTYTFKVYNITRGWWQSISYVSTTYSNTTNGSQNLSNWGLNNRGGTYDFISKVVSSIAHKNVKYCFLGHSVPEGYNSTGIGNEWPAKAMVSSGKSFTKLCSGGNTIMGILQCQYEMFLINAEHYILQDPRNDSALGRSRSQWSTDYQSMYHYVKGTLGKRVIIAFAIPSTDIDLRKVNSFLSATYSSDTIVDLFNTALLSPPYSMIVHYSGDVTDDGTHPGINGHLLIGNTMSPHIH